MGRLRVGTKVEISLEEETLRDVWFPATIIEDLGNNLFLVEYNCLGSNDESELHEGSVDHLHIRPSVPEIRVASFGLLEKVDAFYDFGWWSGVITKKLADSRYVVYFKHTNKVKEFSHLELRPHVEWKDNQSFTTCQVPVSDDAVHDELGETATLNLTNPIEDTLTCIVKQTYSLRRSMKRLKQTNIVSNDEIIAPCKKLTAGIASHDPSLSNEGPSKEVSNQSNGQTIDKTKRLFCGTKTPAKQDKTVNLKHPMITSARKKGKLSVDSKGLKALLKGGLGLTKAPNSVKGKHVTRNIPSPVIIGLRCKALTASESKKSKQLIYKSPENVGEPEAPQSSVPMASKTTDIQEKEADGDMSTKRKWGKTFRRQPTNRKTSLASNNQNGDANVKKLPNRRGVETLQQEKSNTPVTGKRGRRRKISLNTESSPQDLDDSSARIENENSGSVVEKSLDSVSETQPLSKWFLASLESAGKTPSGDFNIPPSIANGNDQMPSFEKRSLFWTTIESMEAFCKFPQNPHFRPLDDVNESARERHAIYKMVDFSSVFEDICRLRRDNPRTEIEGHLETLLELETHGFNINPLRNRLLEMLSWKDKWEALETGSNKPEDNLETERVKVQERNIDILLINRQIEELRDKRDRLVKENGESTLKIVAWEEEVEENEEAKRECDRKFYELVTAPF